MFKKKGKKCVGAALVIWKLCAPLCVSSGVGLAAYLAAAERQLFKTLDKRFCSRV
jgi:hypothetical protein